MTKFDIQHPMMNRFKGTINLGHLWTLDYEFLKVYAQVHEITICSVDRCYILWLLARGKHHIAELGVAAGGTARLMNLAAPAANIHLYDTFEGVPENNEGIRKGSYKCKAKDVQKLIPKATLFQGRFEHHTWPKIRYGLVHLDCDLAKPTRAALRWFWPALYQGGVMIIDDYGINLPRLTKIVDDFAFFNDANILRFSYAQAVIIKEVD